MGDSIGVINEVGDMGLGFDELSEKDTIQYQAEQKKKKEEEKKDK